MKKLSNFKHAKNKLAKFRPSRWTFIRGTALVIGSLIVVTTLPFFSNGYSSEVYLQVPSADNSAATDYLPISIEMDELSDRNNDDAVLAAEIESTTVKSAADTSVEAISVEKNTYQITEHDTETGIPVELLDASQFVSDNTIVYVNTSGVNVRTIPSAGGELVSTLSYSNVATRVGIGSSWSKIELSDGSVGFVLTQFLSTEFIATPTPTPIPTPTPTPKPAVTESSASGTFYAIGELNVRTGPGKEYSVTKTLSVGSPVEVAAETSNGWYKTVKGTYVLAKLVTSEAPSVSSSSSSSGSSSSSAAAPVTPADPASSDFVTYCQSFIGVPYVFTGGSTSGFDCSGYASYVYSNYFGISLPHQSNSIAGQGTGVSAADVQVGDVVCYDYSGDGVVDHVSIYIGGGAIVHASSSRGQVVQGTLSTSSVTTIRRFL